MLLPLVRRLSCAGALVLAVGLVPAVSLAQVPSGAPVVAASAPDPARVLEILDDFTIDPSRPLTVEPDEFVAARLDLAAARDALRAAPDLTASALGGGAQDLQRIALPAPDGSTALFEIAEDPIMAPGLQSAHPQIRTYAGRSVPDATSTVRLDLTPAGFHASVRGPSGQDAWYVDPFYRDGGSTYVSYFGAAVPPVQESFVERDLGDTREILAAAPRRTEPGALVSRRTYRLAFVTDPTYADYVGGPDGGTDAEVLAAKTTLINRVNQVYNDDLAIRYELIAQTDRLNLATRPEATAPDGPCGASACYDADTFYSDGTTTDGEMDAPDGCTGALLDRNTFVLGQLVGADAYDLGHIGLGVNGGGIAGLGVVGGADKAAGCTGLPFPVGDFYAIDYFAHEVGHQMGGNHTFNGDQVNCSTLNRNGEVPLINPSTAVEPGSGSTVMAYAGICGQDNLQPHSDPVFSQRSIDEITGTATADPSRPSEVQTITLDDFDADGDSFLLTYPDAEPVRITRGNPLTGGNYTTLQLAQAVDTLTGCRVQVGGYDGADAVLAPTDDGFTVTSDLDCSGEDLDRLGVADGTGGVTGFTGVQVEGGPSTNGGSTVVATTNHAPTVTAPADKTIPARTPFTLTGTGTDQDSDQTLRYLWEQNDEGGATGTALVDNTKRDGPLFRVFGAAADVSLDEALVSPSPGQNVASTDPSRTFPDLDQVLADNTNAETGECPTAPASPAVVPASVIECFSEFLPTTDYGNPVAGAALTFRLTARDGFATGGGTQHDDVTLSVDTAAGPFQVTSRPTAGQPVEAGAAETVTWDVNGTDAAGLAPTVRILLSTDGGKSFPTTLTPAPVPNDGSAPVTIPEVDTDRARIKVEAVDNYFFDVNDADFVIEGPEPLPLPQTRITDGVRPDSFVVGRTTGARYVSDQADATFLCALDGRLFDCPDDGSTVLQGLRAGTHVLKVAAVNSDGALDPTPAVRRFAVMADDRALRRATGGWRTLDGTRAYNGSVSRTGRAGQVLSVRVTGARKIALLVTKGPNFGPVTVTLGNRTLRTLRTAAPSVRPRVKLGVATSSRPVTGTLKIRTTRARTVQVDGIGVLRRR